MVGYFVPIDADAYLWQEGKRDRYVQLFFSFGKNLIF